MLETAQNRLTTAEKDGNDWEVGYAHLDVAQSLLREFKDWKTFQENAQEGLSQADQAVAVFRDISHSGGIASAHLIRASIYTRLADGEEDQGNKAERVEQALNACQAAQGALDPEKDHAGKIFDVLSSINLLYLALRETFNHQEYQSLMDQLIAANSTALGQVIAEDLTMREEGDATLLTAQLLGALAKIEEDQDEREELLENAGLLALQAGLWLESASDLELIEEALNTYQNSRTELEGNPEADPQSCPQCGTINPAGAKFCNQCGSPLKEGS
jgi:hypothetical protein